MKTEGDSLDKKRNSAKIIVISILMVLLIVGLIMGLPYIVDFAGYIIWLFTPFILSYFISLIVNPMANGIQKRFRLPRSVSAILVMVLTVGVLGGIVVGILWKVIEEIRNIYEDFPIIYQNIASTWYSLKDAFSDFVGMLPKAVQTVIDNFWEQSLNWFANLANELEVIQTAGNAAKKLPNIFISSIVFLISLYFMVSDSKKVANVIKKPFSESFLTRFSELKYEIKNYIGGYIKAQLTIMCISFAIILIGLLILQIKYALIIAIATAIFDALPFFGSGAVLIPWSLVSFITGNFSRGIGLLIIYLTVILMRQLVEPKIVGKNIGMHPLLTLMAMYIGYRTLSIGGMILGPMILVLTVSLYRVGVFDRLIKTAKNISRKIVGEIKKIYISFED